MHYRQSSPFPAQFPGFCLCGASFQVKDKILWDRSIRRATLCPACTTPKMVHHRTINLPNGMVANFYKHPQTGEVSGVKFTDPCGAWNASETYRLKDGKWSPAGCGQEFVFSGVVAHETIVGWLQLAEEPTAAQERG